MPQEEMLSILEHCHSRHCGGHHAGRKTALKILECGFFWPNMFKDAHNFVKSCPECQKTGTMTRKHEMPMRPIQFCEIFDAWGIDFMGPFGNSQGCEYILLAVDYVSRWIEAVAVRKADAKILLKFLTDLIARFGHPKILISDGGSHFINHHVRQFTMKNGIEHRVSTPYHPQTNGLAEVSNREIKAIIQKIIRPDRKDWSQALIPALWAYRTAFNSPLGMSPYRLIYGKACHLPFEIQHKSAWAIQKCNLNL